MGARARHRCEEAAGTTQGSPASRLSPPLLAGAYARCGGPGPCEDELKVVESARVGSEEEEEEVARAGLRWRFFGDEMGRSGWLD